MSAEANPDSGTEDDADSTTPWYTEHSKQPRGPYAPIPFKRGAESDPANRKGTTLDYGTYTDRDTQRTIANGLAILHDEPDRVLLVGGDRQDGFLRDAYYYVRWNADTYEYELLKEGHSNEHNLHTTTGVEGVYRFLDDRIPPNAKVFVHLIWTLNSPFHRLDNPVGPYTIGA